MTTFDLSGALRRLRRAADLSQRELARACGLSQSVVARAERGAGDLPVGALARAAMLAGLRLALLDDAGDEVAPMAGDAVRDGANRRFPAHLDVRYGDEGWWHGPERYAREQPWFTFDRLRYTRDQWRDRAGIPDDHPLPGPADSPAERRARRQATARLRREEESRRRLESGAARPTEQVECRCPPTCDELDDWSGRPVHAPDCRCRCDVG